MFDQLKDAIESTVKQFQEDPESFLSERDIQAVLFVEIRKAMSIPRNDYLARGKNLRFGCKEPFSIRRITTEYHLYNDYKDCFDIAVLSNEQDPDSNLWRQPCSIAIEIKLWQPCYPKPGYCLDVEKLKRYQDRLQKKFPQISAFTGIAMLFVHPWVEEKRWTAILDEHWTAILDEHSVDAYPENGVALHLVTDAKDGHWCKHFLGSSTA